MMKKSGGPAVAIVVLHRGVLRDRRRKGRGGGGGGGGGGGD